MPQVSQQGDQPEDNGGTRFARQQRSQLLSPELRTECRSWLLLMNRPAVVQIIGAPIACAGGVKDAWRETAEWVAGQLAARFGDAVRLEYFDLFDPGCPHVPEGAQLPLVLIEGQVVSSGGKLSIPVIRKHLEELGVVASPAGRRV